MLYKKWAALCLASVIWCVCLVMPCAAETAVSSRSAIVMDATTGEVLIEKDAHTPRAMASTTKLMTALLAAERLDWDATITVPAGAVPVEGTSLYLAAGDRLTVADLVTGLLLASGNDAANVIAFLVSGSLSAFADEMNRRAAAIGMTNSLFVTPSGLDEGDHHSTAYDMALLAGEVLKNERLAAVCRQTQATINSVETTVVNHNKLLKLYDACIGMKNGYTKKSGRCLVSAAQQGHATLICVTLNGGDYWNDHIALYEAGFAQMTDCHLTVPSLPNVAVSGGERERLSLTATAPTVSVPADAVSAITARVIVPRFVWAPIAADTPVGRVVWEYNGQPIAEAPLLTAAGTGARPVAETPTRIWRLFIACLRALLSEP